MVRTTTSIFMVVGKSGLGKSSLNNRMLFGSPRPNEGFKAAGGGEPVTSECESKLVASTPDGGPLRGFDTPGMPDPNGKTLEYRDSIVEAVRGADGLNAVIVLTHYDVDRQHIKDDSETHSIILKQFGRLPCRKILVCRVAVEDGLTKEQQEKDLRGARDWVGTIVARGGLRAAKIVFLQQNSSQGATIVHLRKLVREAPKVKILKGHMSTYSELEQSERYLGALERRKRELVMEKSRLEREKRRLDPVDRAFEVRMEKAKKSGLLLSGAIILGAVLTDTLACLLTAGTVTAAGIAAGGAVRKSYRAYAVKVCRNKMEANNRIRYGLEAEVQQIDKELETGTDKWALQRDVATLRELRKLRTLKNVTAQ